MYFFLITCELSQHKEAAIGTGEEFSTVAASTASKNGEWLKAAQLYEQLYIQNPTKEELNYQTGTNYLRANYPNKALSILTSFDKRHQDTTTEFNGRMARIAKAYYQLGDFQKIETVVKNYKYPKMYRGLAREHLKGLIQLNKERELATYFSKYQQQGIYDDKGKKTNTGFLYRAICNELLLVGKESLLKEYANKYHHWAVQRQSKEKRNLAIATFYQQDYLQAIVALKKAIVMEKSSRHKLELEGLLGVCYAYNNELNKARSQIQTLKNADDLPLRHDAFGAKDYHQARIEVALHQNEKAIQSLKKALSAKAAFWSNRFKEDGLMNGLFGEPDFKKMVQMKSMLNKEN